MYYNYCIRLSVQSHAVANPVHSAGRVLATPGIINPIGVADISTLLSTILPDGVLNEPRKAAGIAPAEFPRVDPLGNRPNDVGASTRPVARSPIGVIGREPPQDPGPAQEIVNQRIDGNHPGASVTPALLPRGSEQNGRECHRDHFVRNAVHVTQRSDQGFPNAGEPVRARECSA